MFGTLEIERLKDRLRADMGLYAPDSLRPIVAGVMQCLLAARSEPYFTERVNINAEGLEDSLRANNPTYAAVMKHSTTMTASIFPCLDESQARDLDAFLEDYHPIQNSSI